MCAVSFGGTSLAIRSPQHLGGRSVRDSRRPRGYPCALTRPSVRASGCRLRCCGGHAFYVSLVNDPGGHRRSCLPTRNQSKGIAIRPSRVCRSIRAYWLRHVSPPRWLRGFQEALLPSSLCPGIPGDWKSPNEPSHRTSLGSVADAEVRRQRPEVVVGGRAAQRALTAPRLSLRPSLSCCYCVHVRSTTFLRLASPPSLMLTL